MKRFITCILYLSINVSNQIKIQGTGGLSYPFTVKGYELTLYEYWEIFVLKNKKRTILWFQVFKKKKPNGS
jgi:hypothetical protein